MAKEYSNGKEFARGSQKKLRDWNMQPIQKVAEEWLRNMTTVQEKDPDLG